MLAPCPFGVLFCDASGDVLATCTAGAGEDTCVRSCCEPLADLELKVARGSNISSVEALGVSDAIGWVGGLPRLMPSSRSMLNVGAGVDRSIRLPTDCTGVTSPSKSISNVDGRALALSVVRANVHAR